MHFDQKTTRLNCPNCGAPIDIHRASCEYCGTPYERNEEKIVFYADNAPLYIYQEPSLLKNIDPIEFQEMLLNEENRRLRNQLDASILGVNNLMNFQAATNALNANVLHGFGKIEECINAYPKVESDSSAADCVPGIWEEPVCPEHSMLKGILLLLAMCAPVIVFIYLKVFNII